MGFRSQRHRIGPFGSDSSGRLWMLSFSQFDRLVEGRQQVLCALHWIEQEQLKQLLPWLLGAVVKLVTYMIVPGRTAFHQSVKYYA
jgi:hypothetical protein